MINDGSVPVRADSAAVMVDRRSRSTPDRNSSGNGMPMLQAGSTTRKWPAVLSAAASVLVGVSLVWQFADEPPPATTFEVAETVDPAENLAYEDFEETVEQPTALPQRIAAAPLRNEYLNRPSPLPNFRVPTATPQPRGDWEPVSTPHFLQPPELNAVSSGAEKETPMQLPAPATDEDDLLADEGEEEPTPLPEVMPSQPEILPPLPNNLPPEDAGYPLNETPPIQPQPSAPQSPPPSASPHSSFASPHSFHGSAKPAAPAVHGTSDVDPHLALFAKNNYPSARECAVCHQQHFEEWSVSSHAYACISPMFHKFEQKINELAQGTIGYFCLRCHTPVGTALGVPRDAAIWEMPLVAREGVTCIVCHRVNQNYGKVNGERHIVPGPVTDPIYGNIGGEGIARTLADKDNFKVKTTEDKNPGQLIHSAGRFFEQLNRSEFCASCHQVQVHPGIKLEVVYEQYRASPAYKKGIQCQDCHMGKVPGLPNGYSCGAVAIMNGKAINTERKHSNHVFHGPGYSIAHPGIFPHNVKADRWSPDQWLQFDWRAGWGTEDFEDRVDSGEIQVAFPPAWQEADDRMDAREILDANLKLLRTKTHDREQVMENGSRLDGPYLDSEPMRGQDLRFHFDFRNINEGHNLLTGSLGAQPQLWLNVALVSPSGKTVWESGYTDRYGDVADIHSEDVRQKRLPFDSQLFNLQTMFLITNVKGADREFPLPVNVDFDQLPFIRPGAQPISVLNHPPFIRMEAHSVAPLGMRPAKYKVPAAALQEPGTYRLSVRMRSRVEPMYFMRFCETTVEQQRMMNEGMLNIHRHSVQFEVR